MWYWICIFSVALAAAALLLIIVAPYRMLQILVWILRHTVYRVRFANLEAIPARGGALLAANHVSPLDGLIIVGATRRKVHFLMAERFSRHPVFRGMLRRLGVVPVPEPGHPRQLMEFFESVRRLLRQGEIVCTFPEGGVSGNGLIMNFKNGFGELLPPECEDIPVIPVRLGMIWGSLFAVQGEKFRFVRPLQWPVPVDIAVGRPVPRDISAFRLRQTISELGADAEREPFPGEKPLHYAFARRARRHPRNLSYLDFEGKPCRDFELLVRALVLSRLIRQLDPAQSEYIGVLLPNCSAAAAALLGVLYADRTPAMLNYTAGIEALRAAARKANLKVILTSRRFLEKLQLEPMPEMVFLEEIARTVPASLKRRTALAAALLPTGLLMRRFSPLSRASLDRDAVLLFSSGSTGVPKGVMLSHHNINSNIQSFWRTINWTRRDSAVGNLPLFHAFGFTVCFAFSAISGTRIVYIANPLDAAGVCRLIEQERCTLMMATPTFLQNYMRKYQDGQFRSLRLVITGAEKLRHDISRRFHELTGLTITEGFGCTETSPIVAINLAGSVFDLGRKAGKNDSIGAPLPGIHVKITDPETFEELPPDTPGLMLVKGGLVMKGYLDDPEATARAMHKGSYITGDIASMSPDGYITITGRLSRFSKIAGEMVPHELVELAINEVLESRDRCVAVIGRSDEKRGEKLVVYYATDQLEPEKMIEALRARKLPNLWIPKAADFLRIEQIPLLGSGKIDLQKLKALQS